MAAPVLVSSEFVSGAPFLIKKLVFTTGNTATAFDHGGPGVPDLMFSRANITNPTASEVSVYGETATQFTLDCESDGIASGASVYLMWFKQATGGIS